MYRFKKGSGFPVSVPSVDLVEIGAGGGSLARVDRFGLLKVGPESAGAEPGPASYGRGGTEPAVTDADVVLGLLDPAAFLGGDMPLDADRWPRRPPPPSAPRSASMPSPRRPASTTSWPRTWPPPLACTPSSRASTCAASRCWPSAAPGPCTPAPWPSCSIPTTSSSRSTPACCRRSGRWCRRCASTWPARCPAGSTPSTPPSATPCSTTSGPRAAGCWPPPVRPRSEVRFRYGLDARYVGQGNEVTVWVGEGATLAGRRRRRAGRLRGRVPADLRADHPRRRHRGRHVATRRSSPTPSTSSRRRVPRRRRLRRAQRGIEPSPSTAAATAVTHSRLPPPPARRRRRLRRSGHRRGARDDDGDPPGLDRHGRRRREPRAPDASEADRRHEPALRRRSSWRSAGRA